MSEKYFYGYYVSLDATGVEPVDRVLEAVASACKAAHLTADWRELGLIDVIQGAAIKAAQDVKTRDAEVQRLERVLSRVQRIVRNWQNDTSQRDYDALDELSTILQAVALAGKEATDE